MPIHPQKKEVGRRKERQETVKIDGKSVIVRYLPSDWRVIPIPKKEVRH